MRAGTVNLAVADGSGGMDPARWIWCVCDVGALGEARLLSTIRDCQVWVFIGGEARQEAFLMGAGPHLR